MNIKTFRSSPVPLLFAAFALCSCHYEYSEDEINNAPSTAGLTEINVNLTMADLDECFAGSSLATRAAGEMIYPITIFYASVSLADVHLLRTDITTPNFTIKLPNGEHEVYALCGLSSNVVPTDNITSIVNIRNLSPDKYDFALAKQTVTVEDGICSPSQLDLTAHHQAAWLNVSITDVPSYVKDIQLYAEDLYEWFRFDTGWSTESSPLNKHTSIPLTKDGTSYTAGCALPPSLNTSAVTISAIVTTTAGNTIHMYIPSSRPLAKGSRLNVETDFHGMAVIEEGVTIADWTDDYFTGSMKEYNGLSVGMQYFTLPATVVAIGQELIQIMPHKPMTTTLAEMRSWPNYRDIDYTLSPSISVSRWAVPLSKTSPNYTLAAIQACGWTAFCRQFANSGNTPIDQSATNIIAYYDQSANVFYRFDFENYTLVPINEETDGEYLLYPIGVLNLI